MAQTRSSPASVPVDTPAPVRAHGSRDLLIDVVRGIAISLVALGHTNQGLMHRNWWGSSTMGVRLDAAIYSFHMPAFFFVSGVFLRRSVSKRGERGYTLQKLRTIMYPYLLWSLIIVAATVPLGRFMMQNIRPTWKEFLMGLITGDTSWFLPTLFCALMIGMLLRHLPMPLLFVLAAASCLWLPHTNIAFEEKAARNFVFMVAGMWVGSSFTRMQRIPSSAAAATAAVFAVAIVWVTGKPWGNSSYLFIPLGLLGTLMLMLIAKCLGRSTTSRALAWTGAASFGIFLLSAFPQGAGREFMARVLHITAPWPQLIIPTMLAVAIPAWLYHRRKPLHMEWMFIWPF